MSDCPGLPKVAELPCSLDTRISFCYPCHGLHSVLKRHKILLLFSFMSVYTSSVWEGGGIWSNKHSSHPEHLRCQKQTGVCMLSYDKVDLASSFAFSSEVPKALIFSMFSPGFWALFCGGWTSCCWLKTQESMAWVSACAQTVVSPLNILCSVFPLAALSPWARGSCGLNVNSPTVWWSLVNSRGWLRAGPEGKISCSP